MTRLMNPYLYNVTLRQVEFDGEALFEARVKELPDVRDYAASAEEAYDLAIDTIETSAAVFAEEGRLFPPPTTPQSDFSGRVTLRLPKSLHRVLAQEAEGEGVSLNHLLVSVLTYDIGARRAVEVPAVPSWNRVPRRASATSKIVTLRDRVEIPRLHSAHDSASAAGPVQHAAA